MLSVVIVNHNNWDDVCRLVGALSGGTEVAAGIAEVVLVDNGSEGPIPAEVLDRSPCVRLVARGNGGFAAGVNSGWQAARGRWLLVLNPDVVVSEDWLGPVVSRIHRLEARAAQPPPAIVGFGLKNPDGSRQPSVGAFPSLPRTVWEQLIPRSRRKYQADWRICPGRVPWVTGACMLVDTRLLADLGGMDEDFFLYYEEVALCRAAHRRGWRVEFDPSLAATHLRPLQNRAVSPKMRVITRHSKLLYFHKHLPHWQFVGLSWMISLEATCLGLWSRWRRRAEDARAWRTIRGVARGFRRGAVVRGREVLALADSVASDQPIAGVRMDSAGTHRAAPAKAARLLTPRKDRPACQ
jgi:GT2 family glycosyltransferase